ncbi:hypothetical protein H2198_002404 [Neophaeococcomyces mojaviensis]|uniref:Uncharacterized protein n=1 Tax=Neophaeococcomyces mojaviensis TaxID=3383035 RepID=A0ACC3AF92_9EURO|nr:hypothetical protein H2198_002404 [Knufia sp. JES_112]
MPSKFTEMLDDTYQVTSPDYDQDIIRGKLRQQQLFREPELIIKQLGKYQNQTHEQTLELRPTLSGLHAVPEFI